HLRQDATHEQLLQVGNGCTDLLTNELVTWTYVDGATTSVVGWTSATRGLLVSPTRIRHLAVTFDGTNTRIYTDGTSRPVTVGVGSDHGDWGNFPNPVGAMLGGQVAGPAGSNFLGMLDEVTLYNRALTSNDIASIAGGAGFSFGKCKPVPRVCTPGLPPSF